MGNLSAHFDREEIACPHCQACQVKASALLALEAFRAAVGQPLKVLSGYRCPEHNAAIGGEQGSKHCDGIAFDVACPSGVTLAQFYAIADKQFANGGVGVYPAGFGQQHDFLHVDTRGTRARWSRINGSYLGVQEGLTKGSKP